MRTGQPPTASGQGGSRPNVVLIVLDTFRRDALGLYSRAATTPNLDRFGVEDAVAYGRAYTTAPWTLPAHASLFTGLNPQRHGAWPRSSRDGMGALDARIPTIASELAANGYQTASIAANPFLGEGYGLDRSFQHLDVRGSVFFKPSLYRVRLRLPGWASLRPEVAAYRSGRLITNAAVQWLQSAQRQTQPYLLFLNYFDTHTPYVRHRQFRTDTTGGTPGLVPYWGYHLEQAGEVMRGERNLSPQEIDALRTLYGQQVTYLDREIGRLLDFLRTLPGYRDMMIVVTADHGEMLGEHGLLLHSGGLWEELVAVPLLVKFPDGEKNSRRRPPHEVAQITDVLPTVLETAGLKSRLDTDGVPLSQTRSVVYLGERIHPRIRALVPRLPRALDGVIVDHLKVVQEGARTCAFDLQWDPGEGNPVTGGDTTPFVKSMAALSALVNTQAMHSPPKRVPAETLEALRALGYVK